MRLVGDEGGGEGGRGGGGAGEGWEGSLNHVVGENISSGNNSNSNR